MVIKAIAQEVYRCQSLVHQLEDRLRQADAGDKATIEEELRLARAELKQVKNMLDNKKASTSKKPKRFPY